MPDKPTVDPVDPADLDGELTVDPRGGETARPDWAYDSCTEPAGGQSSPSSAPAGTPHDG